MRSSAVLDQGSRTGQANPARELLVLWQHPSTRAIVPIGRLGFDGATYTFGYTQAAAASRPCARSPGFRISPVRIRATDCRQYSGNA